MHTRSKSMGSFAAVLDVINQAKTDSSKKLQDEQRSIIESIKKFTDLMPTVDDEEEIFVHSNTAIQLVSLVEEFARSVSKGLERLSETTHPLAGTCFILAT